MELDDQERKIVVKALEEWQRTGKLSAAQKTDLEQTLETRNNDRQQIARYFFIIAVSSMLLAFSSIFIDDKLLETVKKYFSLSNLTIALGVSALTIVWFYYVRKKRPILHDFTYEVFMIVGALGSLTALVYFCKDYTGVAHYTFVLLLATTLLFVLSISFRSVALWTSALLSFCGWFGAFTTWQGKDNAFLGMNYPVRFVVFGALLIGISHLQKSITRLQFTQRITYIFGLITFFTAMWGVSIFGNFIHFDAWEQVRQTHVLVYAIAFAIVAFAAFFSGIRYKDENTRDFGIFFLLINLYTRYFEYFWNTLHKGIFFLILAVSFWFLGKRLTAVKREKSNVSGES